MCKVRSEIPFPAYVNNLLMEYLSYSILLRSRAESKQAVVDDRFTPFDEAGDSCATRHCDVAAQQLKSIK